MKKVYLFIYSDKMGDRESIKNSLDSIVEILDWRYDLPNCFYLISECSANELSNLIYHKYEERPCRFIISEIQTNRQGYLPKDTWTFLKSINTNNCD